MASTFSPSLRLELIGDGDQSGIWGQTTNNNLGALIEQAIAGVITVNIIDANYTLTNFNGVTDEARNAVITITGSISQQRNIVVPLADKVYTFRNATTGGFGLKIVGASGPQVGVVIPNGATASVYCDGTDVFPLNTGTLDNYSVNGNLNVTGTTTLTGALGGSSAVFSSTVSGTTITASTQFTGPGTGLTGTAAALSIGGNAATATTATTATNATQAANATAVNGASSNGFGTRTVSTSAPTGGSNGDIWYQV